MPATLTKRQYLGPCTGYRSDVARDMAPLGAMTYESRDWLISPAEGQIQLRRGIFLSGETSTARTGLLEAAWQQPTGESFRRGAYCRQLLPLQYPYSDITGGITPTTLPTGIYTDAEELYRQGTVLGVTKGNTFKQLGSDFSTSGTTPTYKIAASYEPYAKIVPLPYISRGGAANGTAVNSGVGYTRCAFEYSRRFVAPGSWRGIQVGRWFYLPNFHGCPAKWDLKTNADGTNATDRYNLRPSGHYPPMFCPTLAGNTTDCIVDATNKVFYQGDSAFVTIMFQYEDGSFSIPYRPNTSQPFTISVTGAGGASDTTTYSSILLRSIAIGEPGVVRRIILATDWVNLGTATIPGTPSGWNPPGGNSTTGRSASDIDLSIANLKVIGIINNNTDTTFKLTTRISGAAAANAVRDDHIWPPSSRYIFEMERRIGMGYSRRINPCAIVLAPISRKGGTYGDLNLANDSASLYSTTAQALQLYRSTAGALTASFRQGDIAAGSNFTANDITTIGGTALAACTLQQLIDTLYATTTASNGGGWAGSLVPGVDGNILCSNLQPTVFQVGTGTVTNNTGTVATTATSPNDFSDVALGMKCRIVSGGGAITGGTGVVIAKASNTSITLGTTGGAAIATTADATGNTVFEFWCDCGDDTWNTDANWGTNRAGNIRAFGPTLPAVIAFNGRYIDALGVDKQRVWFTSSPPGQASMAAESFFNNAANFAGVPASAGVFMGSVPLGRNNLAAYSRSFYVLENRKSGTSGEDQDYHFYPLNTRRGLAFYGTLVSGDGWAGGLTPEGFMVTEGEPGREVIISNALYDPSTGYGVMNPFQASTSLPPYMSAWGDREDPSRQTYHAILSAGKMHLTFAFYDQGGGILDLYPSGRAVYRFSAGIESAGLQEVLRGGVEPWPWSSPLLQQVGTMCAMPDGTLFGAHDRVSATDPLAATLDGTIWKLDAISTASPFYSFDEPITYQVAFGSIQSGSRNLVVPAGPSGYDRVPIGARVSGPGITGFYTVLNKLSDGVTLFLSAANAGAAQTNQTYTVYGQEIGQSDQGASFAFLVQDQCDTVKNLKSCLRFSLRAAIAQGTTLKVTHNHTRSRSQASTFQYSGNGVLQDLVRFQPQRFRQEMPFLARSLGEVSEFSLQVLSPSMGTKFATEVFGIYDVDIDIADSPR